MVEVNLSIINKSKKIIFFQAAQRRQLQDSFFSGYQVIYNMMRKHEFDCILQPMWITKSSECVST